MSEPPRFTRLAPGPVCLYLNADADASFTGHTVPSRLGRVAAALTTHAIVGARPGDAVLLRAEPEEGFVRGLESLGIVEVELIEQHQLRLGTRDSGPGTRDSRLGGTSAPDASSRDRQLEPLAWNHEAHALSSFFPIPPSLFPIPIPTTVRATTHRGFLAALEHQLEPATAPRLVADLDTLVALVGAELARAPRVLVKGVFGSASSGNLRLARHELESPSGRLRLAQLLELHGAAVVEPWLERVLDLCATGAVGADGAVSAIRVDRTVHTDVGSPLGTLFAEDDPLVAPHRDAMLEAVELAGAELARAGYRGPFCLDGLVHRSDGHQHLRRFVDLNPRQPVSWPVRRLLERLDRPGVFYWRLFVPARLGPRGVTRLHELLAAPDAFDCDRVRGLLGLAPQSIRTDGRWTTNPKLAVLIATDTIEQAFSTEHWLRHQIDRRPPA